MKKTIRSFIKILLIVSCYCWMNLSFAIDYLSESTPVQTYQQGQQAQEPANNSNNIQVSNFGNLPQTHLSQNQNAPFSMSSSPSTATTSQNTDPADENATNQGADESAASPSTISANGIDSLAPAAAAAALAQAPTASSPSTTSTTSSSNADNLKSTPPKNNNNPLTTPPSNTQSPQNTQTSDSNLTVPPSSTDSAAAIKVDSISAEVDQMNQQILLFQQQNSNRLENLEKKNADLQSKLDQLNLQIQMINQQISKLNQQGSVRAGKNNDIKTAAIADQTTNPSTQETLGQWIINNAYYLVVGTILIILLIIFLAMLFYGDNSKTQKTKREDSKGSFARNPKTSFSEENPLADEKEEPHFSSSFEAMAAKLDLARAYIAMDDHLAASEVLQEVLAEGTMAQQQEAQELLRSLNISSSP